MQCLKCTTLSEHEAAFTGPWFGTCPTHWTVRYLALGGGLAAQRDLLQAVTVVEGGGWGEQGGDAAAAVGGGEGGAGAPGRRSPLLPSCRGLRPPCSRGVGEGVAPGRLCVGGEGPWGPQVTHVHSV